MIHSVHIPLKVRMIQLVFFLCHMHGSRILGIFSGAEGLLHVVRVARGIVADFDTAERAPTLVEHVAPVAAN